jgi:Xaa-Pro aminopeptidase
MDAFARRRAALADSMRTQGGGLAVIFTAPEVPRNRDSDFPFRYDSYFHYLSGFPEPEAAVVVVAGAAGTRSILFCRSKHEEREIWDGFRYGPKAARKHFGFDEAFPIEEMDSRMPTLLADQSTIFYSLGSSGQLDAHIQRWLGSVRAQARAGVGAPYRALDVTRILDEMRLIKDTEEIAIMRKAAKITAGAHVRAMRQTRPGRHEYEIEAEILYEFRRNGSPFPAYGTIVAGGANACVLHYRENDAKLKDGDLLLIDAGCELDGYAADITRTFPVGGRFSGAQRDLYQLVLASQQAAEQATRPGATFMEPHDAAVKVLAQGMIDCKLVKGSLDGVLESGSYRRFYMHRTGHWLGRDVHDCGDYREPDESIAAGLPVAAGGPTASGREASGSDRSGGDSPAGESPGRDSGRGGRKAKAAEREAARAGAQDTPRGRNRRRDAKAHTPPEKPWRRLVPGMVLTIEPGIYVRDADDVPKAFRNIGIRIEDDALVTAGGCELLTSDVPKAADEIEALMAEARAGQGFAAVANHLDDAAAARDKSKAGAVARDAGRRRQKLPA